MSKTSPLLEYAEPMASWVSKQENVSFALFPQLPYISTARGTHTHPSSLHLGSLALCLRASATCAGGNDVLPFLLNTSHLARFTCRPSAGPNSSIRCKARSTAGQVSTKAPSSRYQAWRRISAHSSSASRLDTNF